MTGRPRAREDVVFRRVGEDWLLFDPELQVIHVLNLSAALVWSFCTGELDEEDIAAQVARAFEAGKGLQDPVHEILERFRNEGLLVEDAGEDPGESREG